MRRGVPKVSLPALQRMGGADCAGAGVVTVAAGVDGACAVFAGCAAEAEGSLGAGAVAAAGGTLPAEATVD